jgi:hypothetical protein
VLRFDTFYGLMLIQMAMAISMPVLIYRIVSRYSPQAGFYAAVFSIASFVPYGYSKAVLTEQPYIFGLLVAMYFASRVIRSHRAIDVYAMAASLFVLQLVRPVAAYLFVPCCLIMILLLRRASRRMVMHFCLSLLLIPVLMYLTTQARNVAIGNPRMAVSTLNSANGTGKLLFYNVYLTGGHLNNEVMRSGGSLDNTPPFISDDVGPAARELRRTLRATLTREYVLRTAPAGSDFVRQFFYDRFRDDPAMLVDEMLASPSMSYYFYMWLVVDDALGPQEADRVFLRLSLELLRTRPLIGAKYLTRNMYFFASGVSLDYIYALHPNYNLKITQSNLNGLVGYTPTKADDVLTPALADELTVKPGGEWNTRLRMLVFYHLWTPLYLVWRPLLFLGMITGPFLLARTSYAPVAILGAVVVLYHMMVVCIFAMPIDRYVVQTSLVELLVAVPACAEGLRRLVRLSESLKLNQGR